MCRARKDFVWGLSFRVCEDLGWLGFPDSIAHPATRLAVFGLHMTFNTERKHLPADRLYGFHADTRVVGHDWPWAVTSHTDFAFGGGVLNFNTHIAAGFGFRLNPQLRLGVVGGLGLGVATVNGAGADVSVPVEVFATALQGDDVNVTAFIRSHFLLAGERIAGPPSVPFGDEFNAGLRVHFVSPRRPFRQYDYYGYAVSIEYREWLATRFVSIGVAWAFPSRFVFQNWLRSWL